MRYAGSSSPASFRCALLGVACDLPAARKCCGLLSYSADLGCSRCFQKFSRGFAQRNNNANFNRGGWQLRTNARHHSDVVKLLKCKSKTERKKAESPLGCRYSVLLELPYFQPIEMLLIDPMHNLFLGTAKHFARDFWIGRNIFDKNAAIQNRYKSSEVIFFHTYPCTQATSADPERPIAAFYDRCVMVTVAKLTNFESFPQAITSFKKK